MKRLYVFAALCLLLMAAVAQAAPTTILVAFGTSQPGAKIALEALNTAYTNAGDTIIWAYTSDKIRRKLAKQGEEVLSVEQAMNKAAALGAKDIRIQSLHVTPAEEFNQLQRMVVRNLHRQPGRFTSVQLGHPLLESSQDLTEVTAAVLGALPKERGPKDAVLLMGHGNDRGPGDLIMQATADAFHKADKRVWLATVEGAHSFDRVLPQLQQAGVRKVWLMPFMIVAGDHANNDLAGADKDSWASRIKAAGMTPVPYLHGLGENAGIQRIFLRHTSAANDDMMKEKE